MVILQQVTGEFAKPLQSQDPGITDLVKVTRVIPVFVIHLRRPTTRPRPSDPPVDQVELDEKI